MSVDEFVKLTEALAKLIGVLIWPVMCFVLLAMFGSNLKDFLSNLGELSFKGGA